jgi:hypothetical protein
MDPYLRAFLSERDEPCPGCGYNLRGLASAMCPECRQPLQLRVNLADPAIGSWVAALIGLVAPAGAAAFELAAVFWLLATQRNQMQPREAFTLIVAPFIILAFQAGLTALLSGRKGRTWFRSLRREVRPRVVAAIWCLAAGWFVLWMALLNL